MVETDDKKIISDVIGGDDAAFGRVLKKYLAPVFGFVYRLVGDREAAEDVTQETFIKAWKNLSRFDQSQSFKTWLFTIAKRTAFDYLKKKKSLPFSAFEDAEGNSFLGQVAEEEIIEKLLEQKDAAVELGKALEKLTKHYQLVLTLRYKDDLSLQEIAEVLGESYNTVKSRHSRALRQLKEMLLH